MKLLSFLLSFTLLCTFGFAQKSDAYFVDVYDNSGKRIDANKYSNIHGSPFLYDKWGTGSVVVNNHQEYTNMPLQFNVENNTLYFKRDNAPFTFADKVISFKITYADSTKNEWEVFFRSGYPDGRGYPTNFLYEVMADGDNIQYLKYLRSHLEQRVIYGNNPEQVYITTEELWLYDAKAKRMFKINKNEKSIAKALPAYAQLIQQFATINHYKLDSDQQIIELVANLNKSK